MAARAIRCDEPPRPASRRDRRSPGNRPPTRPRDQRHRSTVRATARHLPRAARDRFRRSKALATISGDRAASRKRAAAFASSTKKCSTLRANLDHVRRSAVSSESVEIGAVQIQRPAHQRASTSMPADASIDVNRISGSPISAVGSSDSACSIMQCRAIRSSPLPRSRTAGRRANTRRAARSASCGTHGGWHAVDLHAVRRGSDQSERGVKHGGASLQRLQLASAASCESVCPV